LLEDEEKPAETTTTPADAGDAAGPQPAAELALADPNAGDGQ